MGAVVAAGAGALLRADRASLGAAARELLADPRFAAGAASIAGDCAAFDAPARMAAFVAGIFNDHGEATP